MEPFTAAAALNEAIHNTPDQSPRRSSLELPFQNHTKSPSRQRSFSDLNPALSPSPKFKEPPPKSRDDSQQSLTPTRPPRKIALPQGLALQVPSSESASLNVANFRPRGPFSPSIESRDPLGVPGQFLPRHSRGLDFSRACTHLHHSTLAESSPDSSPTITQKHAPSRRGSMYSMVLDSPLLGTGWSGWHNEKALQTSDGSSSSSEDEDLLRPDDADDIMVTTPQVRKQENSGSITPYGAPKAMGISNWLQQATSPGHSNYANFHQHRLTRGRTRKSSSSISGVASPIPLSPHLSHPDTSHGYFGIGTSSTASRRGSLSMGTNGLHISTSGESSDEPVAALPSTPGVVRRPVTRRSNMMPQTKVFARVRKALQEESQPVDADARNEASIVRQVRINDGNNGNSERRMSISSTTPFSPELPQVPLLPLEASSDVDKATESIEGDRRRSGSRDFWTSTAQTGTSEQLHQQHYASSLPKFLRKRSSSGVSLDDMAMDSSRASTPPSLSTISTMSTAQPIDIIRKTSGDSVASTLATSIGPSSYPPPVTAFSDASRKFSSKRRRDEDFDPSSIKRRAVSPGMASSHGSPRMGQSPRETQGVWPTPPAGSATGVSSGGASGRVTREGSLDIEKDREKGGEGLQEAATPRQSKRISLMGMADTSDELMNMTIE